MTDDLHKYPGNLRHHEVKVPRDVRDYLRTISDQSHLIQTLVDVLQQVADEGTWTPEMFEALREAEQHGFKPQ
jgi:hypothetical protein